ncbi:MAG: AAA family ATPase [Pseudomonadota bacterium]
MKLMTTLADHAELIRALAHWLGEACGAPSAIIETHISSVILVGRHAFKLKKPVDFGFVNFLSLADRKHFCEEELRLNGRMAPSIYIDVAPVFGTPSTPRLSGDGEPIEYAVRMHRFEQRELLDRLAESHGIAPVWIDDLAERVAAFHGSIDHVDPAAPWGQPATVIGPVRANFEHLGSLALPQGRLDQVARIAAWTEARIDALSPLLERRRREGWIRECHGDMHLGNMALIGQEIEVFDGIEFNHELRWIDLQSDVAFLTMDLQHRNQAELAWRFLNRYLANTGDYAGMALHAFYQTYRAMVRAKIDGLRATDPSLPDAERTRLQRDLGVLLDLAESFTRLRTPRLALTCGLSGSGKSTAARRIAHREGCIQLRSDVERKRLHGLAARADSRSDIGGGIYGPEASAATYARLLDLTGQLLAADVSVIVDAAFLKRAQRTPFLELAAARGVAAEILWCDADLDVLRERVTARRGDASEATVEVLERQVASFEPPGAGEPFRRFPTDTPSVA